MKKIYNQYLCDIVIGMEWAVHSSTYGTASTSFDVDRKLFISVDVNSKASMSAVFFWHFHLLLYPNKQQIVSDGKCRWSGNKSGWKGNIPIALDHWTVISIVIALKNAASYNMASI